jgi:hypothetical protein
MIIEVRHPQGNGDGVSKTPYILIKIYCHPHTYLD